MQWADTLGQPSPSPLWTPLKSRLSPGASELSPTPLAGSIDFPGDSQEETVLLAHHWLSMMDMPQKQPLQKALGAKVNPQFHSLGTHSGGLVALLR